MCVLLFPQIDVRSISKGISYLNDKLDTIASLTEPRENAFLRYQDNPVSESSSSQTTTRASAPPQTHDSSTQLSLHQPSQHQPTPGTAGFVDIARCLAAFGRIAVSTTYPALCTAKLPHEVHIHLPSKVSRLNAQPLLVGPVVKPSCSLITIWR